MSSIGDSCSQRLCVFSQHGIDPAERVPRSLRHTLPRGRIGDERLRGGWGADLLTALQRNHRDTCQALKVETNLGGRYAPACPMPRRWSASTWRGLSGGQAQMVTSPTRIPLKHRCANQQHRRR